MCLHTCALSPRIYQDADPLGRISPFPDRPSSLGAAVRSRRDVERDTTASLVIGALLVVLHVCGDTCSCEFKFIHTQAAQRHVTSSLGPHAVKRGASTTPTPSCTDIAAVSPNAVDLVAWPLHPPRRLLDLSSTRRPWGCEHQRRAK